MFISPDRWIHIPEPHEHATLHLFCFPHLGGDAASFYSWPPFLPASVELCVLQLPGREHGPDEHFLTDLSTQIQGLTDALQGFLERPFVFFGHCYGALLAFEVASLLRARHLPLPHHFFFSSFPAPHLSHTAKKLHQALTWFDLPETEYRRQVAFLGSFVQRILADPISGERFQRNARLDRPFLQNYRYRQQEPFPVPLTILGGAQDHFLSSGELLAWQDYSSQCWSFHLFSGDHFYPYSQKEALLTLLSESLEQIASQVETGQALAVSKELTAHSSSLYKRGDPRL